MRKHFLAVALLTLLSINVIPAVAQAPPSPATPDAATVERRVESILGKMTLEEKIDLLGGIDGFFIRGVPRLGLPRLKMADGPMGVRNFGPATAMAAGIGLAAKRAGCDCGQHDDNRMPRDDGRRVDDRDRTPDGCE